MKVVKPLLFCALPFLILRSSYCADGVPTSPHGDVALLQLPMLVPHADFRSLSYSSRKNPKGQHEMIIYLEDGGSALSFVNCVLRPVRRGDRVVLLLSIYRAYRKGGRREAWDDPRIEVDREMNRSVAVINFGGYEPTSLEVFYRDDDGEYRVDQKPIVAKAPR